MKTLFALAVIAGMSLVPGSARAQDIVDVAAGNPNFSTLVTAVKAAGLVETLKGAGPFTVFAPTNAAFAKIPKHKLDAILKDKKLLTSILTYHVVPGKVLASDVMALKNGASVKTVQGQSVKIFNKGNVKVNNAKVIQTDVQATNGVIHAIDTVILPKP